jgi:threonine dehydratase
MHGPTYDDVLAAQPHVYAHMRRSALLKHPLLDEWVGRSTWVKHENHNPTGSFKIRGGLNLAARMSDEEKRRGVICASTGNHGQSVATACRLLGIRCRIVVPVGNNPDKTAAMRALGADVQEYGRDFDDAREFVESMSAREGLRYVHNANEPHLIAGVATYALEVFEECPDVDYVFVPIGGGSGAAGCALVRAALGSHAKVIGVQAARADAFARSWRGRVRVDGTAETFAEGIATRTTFDLTFTMLKTSLDDIVTLEESELQEGVSASIRCTHNLAEGAGGAAIAAARKTNLPGDARIVCVMSGGNADERTLRRALA